MDLQHLLSVDNDRSCHPELGHNGPVDRSWPLLSDPSCCVSQQPETKVNGESQGSWAIFICSSTSIHSLTTYYTVWHVYVLGLSTASLFLHYLLFSLTFFLRQPNNEAVKASIKKLMKKEVPFKVKVGRDFIWNSRDVIGIDIEPWGRQGSYSFLKGISIREKNLTNDCLSFLAIWEIAEQLLTTQ